MEKGPTEWEQLMLDIADAKDDIKRSKELRNIDLEVKVNERLNLLLKEKERLTNRFNSAGN